MDFGLPCGRRSGSRDFISCIVNYFVAVILIQYVSISKQIFMKKVIIYSTPTCTYCKLAKEFFAEKGVSYEEHDVASDVEQRKAMVDKSGQLGVPVIDIEGQIIVGFDKETVASALGI